MLKEGGGLSSDDSTDSASSSAEPFQMNPGVIRRRTPGFYAADNTHSILFLIFWGIQG